MVDGGLAVLARGKQVEIADRILAAPIAAGDNHVPDAWAVLHVGSERLGKVLGRRNLEAALTGAVLANFVQDFGFGLFAKARERAHLVRLGSARKLVEGLDPEAFVERVDTLRAKPRERRQLGERGRRARLDLLEHAQASRFDDLCNLARKILADAGQLRQVLAACDHLCGALRQILDGLGGAAIGANAKRVCVVDLEEIGKLVEEACNIGVVDGHRYR